MASTDSHSHTKIWSIPSIRSTILLHLPTINILTLLRTSHIHQQAAIERLYKVFPYRHLNTLLKRCSNEVRKHLYLNAIQSLTLHNLDPPFTHPTQWIDLFHHLPNCLRILEPNPYWGNTDTAYAPCVLSRSWSSDDIAEYKFHSTLPSHTLTPKNHPEIPTDWRLIKGTDLSCSIGDLTLDERAENLKQVMKGVMDLIPKLHEDSNHFLRHILSYPRIQYYFLTIRYGVCTPLNLEMIVPYPMDGTSLKILEFASPHLLALDLEFEPSDRMVRLDEIDWEGMINLQELVLQLHRPGSPDPIISESSNSHEHLLMEHAIPDRGLKHFTLSLIYDEPLGYSELQSIQEQEENFIRSMARYFLNFFDPYYRPRLAVEVRGFSTLPVDEFEKQLQVCLVDEVDRLIRESRKGEEALVEFWT